MKDSRREERHGEAWLDIDTRTTAKTIHRTILPVAPPLLLGPTDSSRKRRTATPQTTIRQAVMTAARRVAKLSRRVARTAEARRPTRKALPRKTKEARRRGVDWSLTVLLVSPPLP